MLAKRDDYGAVFSEIEYPLQDGRAAGIITAVAYRAQDSARLQVCAIACTDDSTVLMATIDGDIADIYLTLQPPSSSISSVNVDWHNDLDGHFLKLAALTASGLELSLAGLRKADAHTIAACAVPDELQRLLRDRWTLSGETALCTLRWDSPSSRRCAQVIDARKRTSTPGEVDQVRDVAISVVDGRYEIGWPLRLSADYNQDGEVGASDLTPLGIFFGLKSDTFGWFLEALRRVDGDGNGVINAADITPLGYNYGNQLLSFRIERSDGDAAGPGAEWESVGDYGRATVTQYGEPVTSTSGPAYQRVLVDTAPGWMYYRAVALEGAGWEAQPSEPVLAPDVTLPSWSADPSLQRDLEIEQDYYFTFAETAVDDRGQIDYGLQLTGGIADPDEMLLMLELNGLTSPDPVISPYRLSGYVEPYYPYNERSIRLIQGEQYYLRLIALDSSGNCVLADWYPFTATKEQADETTVSFESDVELWVNKEGTVRFKPPTVLITRGMSDTAAVYSMVLPVTDNETLHSLPEHYDPGTRIDYTGGEIVWEHVLQPDQRMYVGLAFNDPDGTTKFDTWSVVYPEIWIKPFDKQDETTDSFTALSKPDYLSNGTAVWWDTISADNLPYIFTIAGGAVCPENVEEVPLDAYGSTAAYSPVLNRLNGDLIFHEDTSSNPGSVTWFRPRQGVIGRAIEPAGAFTRNMDTQDYIINWEPEDVDTVIGVRCAPQDGGNGTLGFELWEARRDGAMQVRETVYPQEVVDQDIAQVLPVTDEQLALNVRIYAGTGLLGKPLYNDYYAFRDNAGDWLIIDGEEPPSSFAAGNWDYINFTLYGHCQETAYLHIYALANHQDDDEDNDISYCGIFAGDLKAGQDTFILLYDTQSNRGSTFDPPFASDRQFELLQPFDGTSSIEIYPHTYLIHPDGSYETTRFNSSADDYNLEECAMYWRNCNFVPGFVKANISEDGAWLSPLGNGVWGLGYWVD